jgi:lipopolysaccharide transport system ATP-binding protein
MTEPAIVFDRVWKKFRRGERHDSLRDAITAAAKWPFTKRRRQALGRQEFWALRDVSFEVKPGEAIGIIGANGAGKSTALKLLSKILRPTSGACRVQGRVGALIEIAAGFHPDLTGRENLYLQGAIMGMKRAEVTGKLDDIIDFSGIRDFIDTPVKRYSSGMNARLGFAIAAHVDPDVLLIDEVLAVGDFAFQQKCYRRLQDFRESGAAIVFVSHNMQAIASLCDRALLLRPNQTSILGSVSDVSSLYASADSAANDPRVTVRGFTIHRHGERAPLDGAVVPGTPLVLDIELEANTTLPRCSVGLEVVRSDGLVMFNGGPMIDGRPPIDLEPGARLRARIQFRANVLRGTYRIMLNVVDANKTWPLIAISGLASFVVNETTRVAGCAELEPVYDLSVERPQFAEPPAKGRATTIPA